METLRYMKSCKPKVTVLCKVCLSRPIIQFLLGPKLSHRADWWHHSCRWNGLRWECDRPGHSGRVDPFQDTGGWRVECEQHRPLRRQTHKVGESAAWEQPRPVAVPRGQQWQRWQHKGQHDTWGKPEPAQPLSQNILYLKIYFWKGRGKKSSFKLF